MLIHYGDSLPNSRIVSVVQACAHFERRESPEEPLTTPAEYALNRTKALSTSRRIASGRDGFGSGCAAVQESRQAGAVVQLMSGMKTR
jgi:hypothetical protein